MPSKKNRQQCNSEWISLNQIINKWNSRFPLSLLPLLLFLAVSSLSSRWLEEALPVHPDGAGGVDGAGHVAHALEMVHLRGFPAKNEKTSILKKNFFISIQLPAGKPPTSTAARSHLFLKNNCVFLFICLIKSRAAFTFDDPVHGPWALVLPLRLKLRLEELGHADSHNSAQGKSIFWQKVY